MSLYAGVRRGIGAMGGGLRIFKEDRVLSILIMKMICWQSLALVII